MTMTKRELLDALLDAPDDALIYLDDTEMPTPLTLTNVTVENLTAVHVESGIKFTMPVVTLSTYNWKGE